MEATADESSQGGETFAGSNVSTESQSQPLSFLATDASHFFPLDGLFVLAFSEIK